MSVFCTVIIAMHVCWVFCQVKNISTGSYQGQQDTGTVTGPEASRRVCPRNAPTRKLPTVEGQDLSRRQGW